MRLIIHRVYEKSTGGDYAEFEEMRNSLVSWLEESGPTNRRSACQPGCGHGDTRGDLIRLMAILQS
jgi:hypothetical protein